MVNCSWEEWVAGHGWMEYTALDGSRDTRSLAGQKAVGNEMQPTLISSTDGAELLASRGATYLVSMERKVASCIPFPQQGVQDIHSSHHPDLLAWLSALSRGLCTCGSGYRRDYSL